MMPLVTKQAKLAITAGEPAGIGADLCVLLAAKGALPSNVVVIGDQYLLQARALQLGLTVQIQTVQSELPITPHTLLVEHIPLSVPVVAGVLNAANAAYVLATLDHALQGCLQGKYAGMVTAPVHKGIINAAGVAFSGHTEYLAEHSQTAQVVMMLVGGGLRVALATTHLPLQAVSQALTMQSLRTTLQILYADCQTKFKIAAPRILVAGLNPHAGEDGHLGREEIEVITPVLQALRAKGMDLIGPLPADTLFTPKYLQQADAVLAMYHDQGLPVLKFASFGSGVNITLGLPFVRTSVDHGTALDLAGSGQIETGSMVAAIALAQQLTASPPTPSVV